MDPKVNFPVRLFFKKVGRASYISHLDLSRCMSRSIIRAGLPGWYTMGFNPHLFRTFALPLSLGVEGLKEVCDVKFSQEVPFEEIKEKLNGALPEGIEIIDVAEAIHDPKDIMWAAYSIYLDCDAEEAKNAVAALLSMEEINVDKKTKKGAVKQQNIKELFTDLKITGEGFKAEIDVMCRAGVEVNLNPSLIMEALNKYENFRPYFTKVVRKAILISDLSEFR